MSSLPRFAAVAPVRLGLDHALFFHHLLVALFHPAQTPLRETPANQDYASGHSIEGGAGSEVLKQFFGTGGMRFQDCSTTLPAGGTCSDPSPVLRSFATFSQAAAENAYSRILIGFHFRKSVEEGTAYGRDIGKRAANLYFHPVN